MWSSFSKQIWKTQIVKFILKNIFEKPTWSLISLRTLSVTTMVKFFLFLFFHLKWSLWSIEFQFKDLNLKIENLSTCEIGWSDFSSYVAGPESMNPRQKYQGHTCVIIFPDAPQFDEQDVQKFFLAKMVRRWAKF